MFMECSASVLRRTYYSLILTLKCEISRKLHSQMVRSDQSARKKVDENKNENETAKRPNMGNKNSI